MKIFIALFDKDEIYASRLLKGLQMGYAKQTSVKCFSDEKLFISELETQYFDIAIMDQACMHLKSYVPDRTITALLVKDNSIEEVGGIPTIGRFQGVDNIFKKIVSVYAENSSGVKVKGYDKDSKRMLFTSAQGGTGTSTLAAAYAIYLANKGEKVFYLNLETFGTASSFFEGSGAGSFSDVIYALKRTTVNFPIKLQSIIKKDSCGVEFVDGCRNAFDMLELQDSEISKLMEGISTVNNYDVIIIDYSGALTSRQQKLLKEYSDSVIYVNDGSQIGNIKFNKFCEALHVIEKKQNCSILKKVGLVYNRFSSQTSTQLVQLPVALLGGIHRIEGLSGRDLANELSRHEMMSNIS